jgi:signal peptidase I
MNRRGLLLALASAGAAVAMGAARARPLTDWLQDAGIARRFLAAGIAVHSYTVTSSSMLPTIALDDALLGDLRAAAALPARGEIIVFRHSNGEAWIKRAVGLPGDRVAFKNWRLILNGAEVPRLDAGQGEFTTAGGRRTLSVASEAPPGARAYQIVNGADEPESLRMFADTPEIEVEPGRVYVLGDNRGQSMDSRSPTMGTIAIGEILARVVYRLSPNPGWLAPEQSVPGLPAE